MSFHTLPCVVTIFLDSSVMLKGFMIQARSSELNEEALGTFVTFADTKQRTMTCQSADVSVLIIL